MHEKVSVSVKINESPAGNFSRTRGGDKLLCSLGKAIKVQGRLGDEMGGTLYAGLVFERRYCRENDVFEEQARAVIDIHDLWVDRDFRKKGLGKEMLAELEKAAKGLDVSEIRGVVLDLDLVETPWLWDFYEDKGFETMREDGKGEVRKVLKSQ